MRFLLIIFFINYILHLDIPFTYSALDKAITDKVTAAVRTLNSTSLICPEGTEDKAAYIREHFVALLNDPSLDLHIDLLECYQELLRIFVQE